MREKSHGEQAFIQKQDGKPGSAWDWLQLKRDAIRQIHGFFIGEAPVNSFGQLPASCTAALATGVPRPPGNSQLGRCRSLTVADDHTRAPLVIDTTPTAAAEGS
jgi:hypothetical protein